MRALIMVVVSFASIAAGIAAAYPFSHPSLHPPPPFSSTGSSYVVERGVLKSVDESAHVIVLTAISPYDRGPMTLKIVYDEHTSLSKNGIQVATDEKGSVGRVMADSVGTPVKITLRNVAGALYASVVGLSPQLQPNL